MAARTSTTTGGPWPTTSRATTGRSASTSARSSATRSCGSRALGWDDVPADARGPRPDARHAARRDGRGRRRPARPASTTRRAATPRPRSSPRSTADAGEAGGFYHTHVRYPLGDRYLDPFREAIEIGRRGRRARPHHPLLPPRRPTRAARTSCSRSSTTPAPRASTSPSTRYPSEWASTRLLIQLPAVDPGRRARAAQGATGGHAPPATGSAPSYGARRRLRQPGRLGRRPARRRSAAPTSCAGSRGPSPTSWPRPATTRSTSSATCSSPRTSASTRSRAARGPRPSGRSSSHPVGMVGTDSTFIGAKPSPRTYGSFPRILGQFVRDEALLSLEEAIRKMTGAAAARLGPPPARDDPRRRLRRPRRLRSGRRSAATPRTTSRASSRRASTTSSSTARSWWTAARTPAPRRARDPPRRRLARHARRGRDPRLSRGGRRRLPRRVARRSSAYIRSSPGAAPREGRVAGRAGPADGQAERDRARLQPQLARPPDALDVVDRRDLVGLGQEHAEPARGEPGDVVGVAGEPADRVGERPGRRDRRPPCRAVSTSRSRPPSSKITTVAGR